MEARARTAYPETARARRVPLRAPFALVLGILLAACSTQDEAAPRYVAKQEHFSLRPPAGWTAHRELGSVVFAREGATPTIAVRTAPLAKRDRAAIVPATAKVLRALPGATVSLPTEITLGGMTAVSFDVSYTPDPRSGARYDRRHVVLVGKKHVIHLLHPDRAGSLAGTAAAFAAAIASVREEA
jgi:hypothetical protein